MMNIYKVEAEKLDSCTGRPWGWKLIGYYTNKAKAERVAKEASKTRNRVDTGEIRVVAIEVDTGE